MQFARLILKATNE